MHKDPFTNFILRTWEVKPEDLRALTPYFPYKERAYIHEILVNFISLYKRQAPSYPRYLGLALLELLEITQSLTSPSEGFWLALHQCCL